MTQTQQRLAPRILLNNGQVMPAIGLGTFLAKGKDVEEAVKTAIDTGYRLFDTAFVYKNETEIGRAIKQKIEEGVVKRCDLFITTKLAGIHHEFDQVEHACRLSLAKLNLDYLDLFLIHFPVGELYVSDNVIHTEPSEVDYLETWSAMERLVRLGLVKSIGLSNFNSKQIESIVKNCEIMPVTNQVECHPALNQKKLIEFCRQYQIVLTAYTPLGHPNPENQTPAFLYDSTAKDLEKKYNRTSVQICLRYLMQNGVIPIPKSVKKYRIESNFEVFGFQLSCEDMKTMDSYNTGERMITFGGLENHKYYPFSIEF